MKHSHSHFARLRAGWQSRAVRTVVATGALALVISALPMLALRLTDIGLFTAPHARTQATGVLSQKGMTFTLCVRWPSGASRRAAKAKRPTAKWTWAMRGRR